MFIFLKNTKMEQENINITGGDFVFTNGTTTNTSKFYYDLFAESEVTIVSFEFKQTSDGNFIEVVKRQMPSPNLQLAVWPPRPDVARVWKEIYGVTTEGTGTRNLQLIKTIEAKVTPAHYVDEDIDFE